MIKNIIFDLGGVILNIDFERAAKEFQQLGIDNFEQLYSKAQQNHLFSNLEMGKISSSTFYNEIRKLCNNTISNKEIESAWNAMILDYPPSRIQLLKEVKPNYRVFLLSNTNKIHYDFYQNDLNENHSIPSLESLFDKAYFSHNLGMRKPNKDIFEFVIRDGNLLAAESLFIDDSIQNIDTAQSLGFRTLHIDLESNELSNYFINGKLR